MSMTPLISVVIPTYNRPGFLLKAVKSVLHQTWDDFELIVVDDGSDTSGELPEDPRLRIIRHEENRGVSAARNSGICRAEGKYLAFLDDDDRWVDRKLARQVEFFNRHPEAVAVQPEAIWYRDGKKIDQRHHHEKPDGWILPRALKRCLVSGSGIMVDRTIFNQVGLFDESYPACEDYELWLRIAPRFPVYLIEEPLVIKDGGRSDQLSAEPGLDRYRVRALVKFLKDPLSGPYRQEAREILTKKARIYSQGCRKRGKAAEAQKFENIIDRYGIPGS